MVSNEEIKKMLENRRKGIKTEETPTPQSRPEIKDDMVSCPNCSTKNPTSAKYCVGCGKPLEEEKQEIEPEIQEVEEEVVDYKICPNCNNQNKPEAKFCIVCGQKFDEKISPTESVTPSLKPNRDEKESLVDKVDEPDATEDDLSNAIKDEEKTTSIEEKPLPEIKTFDLSQKEEKIDETESVKEDDADSDVDPVEKIKKAKELLDIGAITQEEFDQIKRKYLEYI